MKHFLVVIFTVMALQAAAAIRDTLIVVPGQDGWTLSYAVRPGETLTAVARRYHVPIELLATANHVTDNDALSGVSMLSVPIGDHNLLTRAPRSTDTARPVYYRVVQGDNLFSIASMAGMTAEQLEHWNGPFGPGDPMPGRLLLVGWVWYDPASFYSGPATVIRSLSDSAESRTEYVPYQPDKSPDSATGTHVGTLEESWNEQTVGGLNVVTEKGTAGFYNVPSNAAGIYAFHNAVSRGTVIRVRNLNNGRVIYVKVLGPLPDIKPYAGCVLGLSSSAKAALGVREHKVFCELSYAGY